MTSATNLPAADPSGRIHREIIQLAVLIAIAGAAFVLTRAVARANQRAGLREAAEWYERGQQRLAAGEVGDAIGAFRRAAARNRADRRYGLALARALATSGQEPSAQRVLLSLREAAPDDPEISVELARLAAGLQDVPGALRYYHAAVYSPWIGWPDRRELRLELIRLLLAQKQAGRALPELLAVSMDLPDQAGPHVEVGELFSAAGDVRQALAQFQRALQLAPRDGQALVGAGLAAFELGEYARARKYLDSAPASVDAVRSTRELVELVLTRDPLASRIRSAERQRRLRANMSYAQERLAACSPPPESSLEDQDLELRKALESFQARLRTPAIREQDTIESGVELTFQIATRLLQTCPSPEPLDRALIVIGRQHGAAEQ